MQELADELGVSESRISQLRAEALAAVEGRHQLAARARVASRPKRVPTVASRAARRRTTRRSPRVPIPRDRVSERPLETTQVVSTHVDDSRSRLRNPQLRGHVRRARSESAALRDGSALRRPGTWARTSRRRRARCASTRTSWRSTPTATCHRPAECWARASRSSRRATASTVPPTTRRASSSARACVRRSPVCARRPATRKTVSRSCRRQKVRSPRCTRCSTASVTSSCRPRTPRRPTPTRSPSGPERDRCSSRSEIDRIAQTTTFGTQVLLNGSFGAQAALVTSTNVVGTTGAVVNSASFSFQLVLDSAATGLTTFTIAVTAVNSAPSFTAGPDQSVLEDAGTQTVTGWATGISPGPGEGGQTVTFSVSNDTPGLFSAQPQVQPNGNTDLHARGERERDRNGDRPGPGRRRHRAGRQRHQRAPDTHDRRCRSQRHARLHRRCRPARPDRQRPARGRRLGHRHLGRTGEGGQAVSFSLSNDNAALFSAQPQVQPDWTLTYTPAAGVSGLATVTARAVDDWRNVGRRQRHQRPADVHDRGDHRERGTGLHGRPGPDSARGRRRPDGGRLGHRHLTRTAGRQRPGRHVQRHERQPGAVQRPAADPAERNPELHPGGETRAGRPP